MTITRRVPDAADDGTWRGLLARLSLDAHVEGVRERRVGSDWVVSVRSASRAGQLLSMLFTVLGLGTLVQALIGEALHGRSTIHWAWAALPLAVAIYGHGWCALPRTTIVVSIGGFSIANPLFRKRWVEKTAFAGASAEKAPPEFFILGPGEIGEPGEDPHRYRVMFTDRAGGREVVVARLKTWERALRIEQVLDHASRAWNAAEARAREDASQG